MKAIIFLLAQILLVLHIEAVPWEPEMRTDDWAVTRHQQNKLSSSSNGSRIYVVFYGDSITEGWLIKDWDNSTGNGADIFNENYAPLGGVNYGIGADKTENLLYRIADGETDGLTAAKLIILKIGTNNGQDSPDDVVRGITAVIDLLREKLPKAKVLLLGLLPRTNAQWFDRVADINGKIGKLDDGKNIRFLDMFTQFASDQWGVVKPELFENDKLHLLTPGYQMWHDTMDALFRDMLWGPNCSKLCTSDAECWDCCGDGSPCRCQAVAIGTALCRRNE